MIDPYVPFTGDGAIFDGCRNFQVYDSVFNGSDGTPPLARYRSN